MAAAGVLSTCTAGPGRVSADGARGPSPAARPGGLVLRKGQIPQGCPIRSHPGPARPGRLRERPSGAASSPDKPVRCATAELNAQNSWKCGLSRHIAVVISATPPIVGHGEEGGRCQRHANPVFTRRRQSAGISTRTIQRLSASSIHILTSPRGSVADSRMTGIPAAVNRWRPALWCK